MKEKDTLVIGANGKTGRRVVERLRIMQVPIRLGSRSGMPPFDWTVPATWATAIRDVRAVYITYFPDLAAPGASTTIAAFAAVAMKAGVQRLVLLSGRGEAEAQHCEEIVQASGLETTILRASWFAQNFSENYLLESILAGEVVLPVGAVGEPFVDADDIADVAVAALTEDRHVGQLYELTGPRLWTFAEAVAEIARATGREISYLQIPIADYAEALRAAQLEPGIVDLITYLFTEVLDGRNASTTDGVQSALGRRPRDFSDYVRATAETGIWQGKQRAAQ
ncbi:MAG: NAD(P)H-binding protein [Rhodospirillaceae bacterium]|nr:NAD(P)H-binding protein [Rhodospirillaceae bacterium]